MTKEQINREVAKKVMGWTWLGGAYFDAYKEHSGYGGEWNPAERIDHAWMVVENLIENGKMIIGGLHFDEAYGRWCFRYRAFGELLHPEAGPWADTAPMAICLAALEAVKEGEGEGKEVNTEPSGVTYRVDAIPDPEAAHQGGGE